MTSQVRRDAPTSARPTDEPSVVLSVRGLTKRFPGVLALKDADIDFLAGTVHVLFGENGAGKSTLVKLLAGVHRPDGGSITLDGVRLPRLDPARSRELGISTVFQEPALVPQLTVAENISLGIEPVSRGRVLRGASRSAARRALERIHADIDTEALVAGLTRAERQIVEIAKSLQRSARVLILDEPTAALTDDESARLFAIISNLRQTGIAIIYITHRVREIRVVGDRISILRDGAVLLTDVLGAIDDEAMISTMAGREVGHLFPRIGFVPGQAVLEVEGLSGHGVQDISIVARAGEVMGLAGLIGSGKSYVGQLIFGLRPAQSGQISIGGQSVSIHTSPAERMRQGVIYYPADRRIDGLISMRPVRENVSLPVLGRWTRYGFIRRRSERQDVAKVLERLVLRPLKPESLPTTFSGGNQQKIVLARGFIEPIRIHIFEEPTSGVDVGARAEIYELIRHLVEDGAAVVLISSDLPEVLGMCRRVYVITEGEVVAELTGDDLVEDRVLPHFFHAGQPDHSRPV